MAKPGRIHIVTEEDFSLSESGRARLCAQAVFLLVKWLCAPRGPEVREGVSIPLPTSWTPLSRNELKGCSYNNSKDRSNPKMLAASLNAFLCFSHLQLHEDFDLSAGLYPLQR